MGLCSKGVLDLMSGLENSGNGVLDLMSGLENNGFHLYTDNCFTSPTLYHQLYNYGVAACGTTRPNREGFPQQLIQRLPSIIVGLDYRSNRPLLASICVDG